MADTEKEAKALLLLKYKETGDKALRNGVILAYMNIVKYAAMSTRNMYLKFAETDDVINEATIALMSAIDSFDPASPTVPEDDPEKGKKILCPELIEWYEDKINMLKNLGCNESTLITHVPLYEYKLAIDAALKSEYNRQDISYEDSFDEKYWNDGYKDSFGVTHESVCYSDLAAGLFSCMKKLGSTKNVLVGHDHINNFSINYEGIRLTYSMASSSHGLKKTVGGTLLTLDDEGKVNLRHVPVDIKIIARARM